MSCVLTCFIVSLVLSIALFPTHHFTSMSRPDPKWHGQKDLANGDWTNLQPRVLLTFCTRAVNQSSWCTRMSMTKISKQFGQKRSLQSGALYVGLQDGMGGNTTHMQGCQAQIQRNFQPASIWDTVKGCCSWMQRTFNRQRQATGIIGCKMSSEFFLQEANAPACGNLSLRLQVLPRPQFLMLFGA